MARNETLARACVLEHPTVAYLVPIRGLDGVVDYEVTWDDLARDAAWLQERFQLLGLEAGHQALLTLSGYEGPWFQPVIEALRNLGVVYGTAETMGWDHLRVQVFHRELVLQAVLGLSADTLDSLSGQAMIGDFFRDTPLVLARPAAARRLRATGVAAAVISPLGPALAIECHERAGAHVNGAEWTVTEQDDALVLTPAGKRTGPPEVRLPLEGSVISGRCGCGSDDPRVLFA